jgi:hypothetical protein
MCTHLRHCTIAFALAALVPAGGRAAPVPAGGDAKPAPALEMVPADAVAFSHVRFAELWDSPFGKAARAAVAREDPQFEERAEKEIGTPLSNLAAFTFVVFSEGPGSMATMLTTRWPYDKAKVLAAGKVTATPQTVAGLEVYTQAPFGRSRLILPDDRHIVAVDWLSAEEAAAYVRRMQQASARGAGDGPLRPALDRAAGKAVLAVGRNLRTQPPLAPGSAVPPPFDGLLPLLKAEWGAATVELGDMTVLDLNLHFGAAGDAREGEKALQTGRKLLLDWLAQAEKAPPPRGSETTVLKLVAKEAKAAPEGARISRTGADVQVRMTTEALATHRPGFAATLATAARTVHEAAEMNHLEQIALAMHNHNDAYQGKLPAHAIYSKDGKTPLLSWRVAILPYIEQDSLYRQFKLDEPWDSEHNKALIDQMPKTYLSPNAPPSQEPGMTYYQIFVGGGAVWENSPKQPGIPRTFLDGASNTLMVVEAAEPVVWTKPDDLTYDPKKPVQKLGARAGAKYLVAAFGDGSVRPIRIDLKEKTLRALITAAGGEVIDHSELDVPR